MKKLLFTSLLLSGFAIGSMAQQIIGNKPSQRMMLPNSEVKEFKTKSSSNDSREYHEMYLDYSVANFDDLFYVWRMSSSYTAIDTALNYVGVTVDQLAGFSDISDPEASIVFGEDLGLQSAYPSYLQVTFDSIFVLITHENNSGTYNKIKFSLNTVSATGVPQATELWSQVDSSNTTLSPGGNWVGTGARVMMAYTPNFTTQPGQKVAMVLTYIDETKLDTFSVIAGCVDDGSGGTMAKSQFPTSFMRYPPNIPNITRTSNVGYGSPVGSNGWFEAQNWGMWAYINFENNVSVNENDAKDFGFGVNPNPASNGKVNVDVQSFVSGPLTIEVVNSLGQVVATRTESVSAGLRRFEMSLENQAQGLYFVRVSTEKSTEVQKVIVK